MSQHCVEAALSKLPFEIGSRPKKSPEGEETSSNSTNYPEFVIPLDDILCPHKKLDHRRKGNMKLITKVSTGSHIR